MPATRSGKGRQSNLLAQTIAITGGTVHPVSGTPIEHATVLVRDGMIVAVGADVVVPDGARVIDARGKVVTPGLFNGGTQLGLTEISAVQSNNEGSLSDNQVAAAFNVAAGINPASQLIAVTRVEGITTALSAPEGGLISGQAVVIDLAGETVADMLVARSAAMVANIAAKGAGGHVVGVIPEFMKARELAFDAADELVTVVTMRERKLLMETRADAFVTLPGGFGTLEEIMEILTLRQTGKMRKNLAIVLFGADYWNEVINFDALVRHGMINRADLDLFHRTDSMDEAFEIVTRHLSDHAIAARGAFL